MAGLRPIELDHFYARLHARNLDTTVLAEIVGCSRPALTRVLNGARKRGPIWRRVARHLHAEEIALLDVAHRSPWNNRRTSRRPTWNTQTAAAVAAAKEARA